MLSQWKHWIGKIYKHTVEKHNGNYEPTKYHTGRCGGSCEARAVSHKEEPKWVSKYLAGTNSYPEHPCGSQYHENPNLGWMDHDQLRKIQKPKKIKWTHKKYKKGMTNLTKESCRTQEDITNKNRLIAKEIEQIMKNIKQAIGTELQNSEGARGTSENTRQNTKKPWNNWDKEMKQIW